MPSMLTTPTTGTGSVPVAPECLYFKLFFEIMFYLYVHVYKYNIISKTYVPVVRVCVVCVALHSFIRSSLPLSTGCRNSYAI